MFKNITIKNFRGIKDLKIEDFGKVNLLVGANNSGKTSILEALYISINPNNPLLFHSTNMIRGLLNSDLNYMAETLQHSLESIFYRFDAQSEIILASEFNSGLKSRIIKFKPMFSDTVTLKKILSNSSNELRNYWQGLNISFAISGLNKKNKSKLESFTSQALIVDEMDQLNRRTIGLKPILSDEYERELKIKDVKNFSGKYLGFNTGLGTSELIGSFDEIKQKKSKKIIIELLQKIEPLVNDLDTVRNSLHVDLEGFDKLARLEILGQGTIKVLSIILNILGDTQNLQDNSILLIDEIENGLHWKSQEILWKFLFEIAREKNIQIFATTHSMDTVKAFTNMAKEQESKEEIRLYRIEKYDDEIIETKYNYEDLKVAINEMKLELR